MHKHSTAHYWNKPQAGTGWNELERAKRQRELNCGFTLFGWDGDTLAWESSPAQDEGDTGRTVHYLYEPGSFVPVAQALRNAPIRLHRQPDWSGRSYDIDQDPLWQEAKKPPPLDAIAWYQCDHLGTPMELTDHNGEVAWSAQYKAWGEVKQERSAWAKQVGLSNPIRFQGQYHDHETGLHYNRYRYYDPEVGRFIGQDPIGYAGGKNFYRYAGNPINWTDPLGLCAGKKISSVGCPTRQLADDAHAVLDPTAQRFKSTAVGVMPDGSMGIASSDKKVPRVQREFAEEKGLAVVNGDGHAEETLINAGATHVDANRGVCLDCETMMRDGKVTTDTPFTGKKSKRRL